MRVSVSGKNYDVEIMHYRRDGRIFDLDRLVDGQDMCPLVSVSTSNKEVREQFMTKGGLTVVHLMRNGEVAAFGQARCSYLDNFNRKKGVEIALGRAVKVLQKV